MLVSNTLRCSLAVFSVVAIGLVAGMMLGSGMQFFTYRSLPETSWTLQHQAVDGLFSRVMPPTFITTLIALVAMAILAPSHARWFFVAAALLVIVTIAITVTVEVPINKTIATWTAGAAPSDWMAIRDRWLSFHWVRTITGTLAFLCAVVGLLRL